MNVTKVVFIFTTVWFVSIIYSCRRTDEHNLKKDELDGLRQITSFSNEFHTISLYTQNGKFQTGYNKIYFQIKDNDYASLVKNANLSCVPLFKNVGFIHSAPSSSISKKENTEATYEGYIVFQKPSNNAEYWELKIDYSIDGRAYSLSGRIHVSPQPLRKFESFIAVDGNRYVLALVEPQEPNEGFNEIIAVIYYTSNMANFKPAENYKLKIDPRMTGIGNQSSLNNEDLTQGGNEKYYGKLNLTTTGYWKLNLQMLNSTGTVLKGEEVTDSNESSSIYFELELEF